MFQGLVARTQHNGYSVVYHAFCSMCIDEAWDECINLSIMESWKLQKLEIERQHDIQVNEHLDNNLSSQW